MDTTTRLITKSVTWQIGGFISMTLIGYLFTGSFVASTGIAIAGSIAGFVTYFLHEMAWSRIKWGQAASAAALQSDAYAQEKTKTRLHQTSDG